MSDWWRCFLQGCLQAMEEIFVVAPLPLKPKGDAHRYCGLLGDQDWALAAVVKSVS